MSETPTVDALTLDFVDRVDLVDIDVVQISINLEPAADQESVPSSDEIEPEFTISFDKHDEENKARFRVLLHIDFPGAGELNIELGAVYDLKDEDLDSLSGDVLTNFFNKVVMMTVFPYLRAEVTYLTGKAFGNPLTLPILKRGDVVFGE